MTILTRLFRRRNQRRRLKWLGSYMAHFNAPKTY